MALLFALLLISACSQNGVESSGLYEIGNYTANITNPDFPDHSIPVSVYYPIHRNETELYPVIVFAHGFLCPSAWYTWVYKDITPMGYIVAYIDSFTGYDMNETQFAIDQRYTLKWFHTVVHYDKSSPLFGRIARDQAVAAGQSEGGGAAFTQAGNPEIDALFDHKFRFNSIFTMAPCGKGGVTAAAAPNVNIPVFVFTGTMDCICPSEEAHRLYFKLPGDTCAFYADLLGGTHCQWLNAKLIDELACIEGEKLLCDILHPHSNDSIKWQEQLHYGSQYMLYFLDFTFGHETNKGHALGSIVSQLNEDLEDGLMKEIRVGNC